MNPALLMGGPPPEALLRRKRRRRVYLFLGIAGLIRLTPAIIKGFSALSSSWTSTPASSAPAALPAANTASADAGQLIFEAPAPGSA